jgi:hypothetical protein
MEGTPGPSSSESKESNVGRKRRIWQSLGAAIALVLAGPALAVALNLLATALLLAGCCALLVVGSPLAIPRLVQDQQTRDIEDRAAATAQVRHEWLIATVTAYPLPSGVEVYAPFEGLAQWDFSPDGEYVALRSAERVGVLNVRTRHMRLAEPPAYGHGNVIWLNERQLLVLVHDATGGPPRSGAYRLLQVQGDDGLAELRESALRTVRARAVASRSLRGKEIYEIRDFEHELLAVALEGSEGRAIIAYNDDDRQAFRTAAAGMRVLEIAPDADWHEPFPQYGGPEPSWRAMARYDAPDGSYYASVWADGARLVILSPGGEVVVETAASAFGPPQTECTLIPIGWLPDSQGVLFFSRCIDTQCGAWLSWCTHAQRAILLLALPERP